jgi:hypothetical protein
MVAGDGRANEHGDAPDPAQHFDDFQPVDRRA